MNSRVTLGSDRYVSSTQENFRQPPSRRTEDGAQERRVFTGRNRQETTPSKAFMILSRKNLNALVEAQSRISIFRWPFTYGYLGQLEQWIV